MVDYALLQWKGGKFQLAEFIIERMPHHDRYAEVFAGGLHVFYQKSLAKENVINDLNQNLINLYRVIADETKKKALMLRLEYSIYHQDLFEEYKTLYFKDTKFPLLPDIERAFIFLYLNRVSFNGEFKDFANRPHDCKLYNMGNVIENVHRKLRAGNTAICRMHFRDFIPKFDSPQTFFYLDPPYWVTTQTKGSTYYEKVMQINEHEELYELLRTVKGKWLMSYDDVDLIRDIYSDYEIIKTPEMHQASANATLGENKKGVRLSEILIANYSMGTAGTMFE